MTFAQQVIAAARAAGQTSYFAGRTAIYTVYSEYGRVYSDAGSLASFKARLVQAAKARHLDLSRADMPEGMGHELAQLSETKWASDEVHFVVFEWV